MIRTQLCLLLRCAMLTARSVAAPPPPSGSPTLQQQHAARIEQVFSEYRKRLDLRFRTAEEAGDIDLMVLIADEKDAPGER